jgi:hypothetical protein
MHKRAFKNVKYPSTMQKFRYVNKIKSLNGKSKLSHGFNQTVNTNKVNPWLVHLYKTQKRPYSARKSKDFHTMVIYPRKRNRGTECLRTMITCDLPKGSVVP